MPLWPDGPYVLQILLENGVVTTAQVERALNQELEISNRLSDSPITREVLERWTVTVLVQQKIVTDEQVAQTVAGHAMMEYIDLTRISIPEQVMKMVPESMARRFKIAPVCVSEDQRLVIAISDPLDVDSCDALQNLLPFPLEFVCATYEAIYAAHGWPYHIVVE